MEIPLLIKGILIGAGTIFFLSKLNIRRIPLQHYEMKISLNGKALYLTFSMYETESLTTDYIKCRFNYNSNDEVIIYDIKSITKEQKNKIINNNG